jgi:hypothetical protein
MMRRAAVEPVISDLKVEQRLDRDYLRAGPAIAQTPCSTPPSTTYFYLCDGSSNIFVHSSKRSCQSSPPLKSAKITLSHSSQPTP